MKVPEAPGASVAMEAGAGPVGAATVPVPVTVGAFGAAFVAAVVPVFVTVSVIVIDWPTLTVVGVAAMDAEIDAREEPTTVKALASSPEVPNGPWTRSVCAPGASRSFGTVAWSVCSSTRRTFVSGSFPSHAWKVSSTVGAPPDDG